MFRRAVSDARPIRSESRAPLPPRSKPVARLRRRDERAVLRESLEADADTSNLQSGDSLRFNRPHIGRRTMRKLARGSFAVQAEIDLHGMTASEAEEALRQFIADAQLRGLRCVRVVHGKGLGSGARGPVLKRKVDAWLRRWQAVLAFVSTRQVDGGTGAVYVLLDRN
ncbi:MAG: Smr/MutS family protein [Gammaproteobacteria bacterium]|nr:Smr/MutS family protein [Gammaproteobacteria bacterium]